jgi:hypothetical protein
MTKETTKPDEDIDPEAIARSNNEGGAPRPLTRGAGRLRPPDAVAFGVRPSRGSGDQRISLIAAGAGEFNEHRDTLVQSDSVIHWPVPKIETDERRHQRQQLENGIAGKAGCTSDPRKNERNRTALCAVAQENRIAGVSSDLWRFSCEMPDAPHLCNS